MTNPNYQKPNEQIEKDEIELAHDRWLSAPAGQKWYLDSGSNRNPLAERAFRRSFVAAAKIAIELVCNSHHRLRKLYQNSLLSRSNLKIRSNLCEHYGLWPIGHEVGAAKLRARCHAYWFISQVQDPDKNKPMLLQWLAALQDWANGDCSKAIDAGDILRPSSWPNPSTAAQLGGNSTQSST